MLLDSIWDWEVRILGSYENWTNADHLCFCRNFWPFRYVLAATEHVPDTQVSDGHRRSHVPLREQDAGKAGAESPSTLRKRESDAKKCVRVIFVTWVLLGVMNFVKTFQKIKRKVNFMQLKYDCMSPSLCNEIPALRSPISNVRLLEILWLMFFYYPSEWLFDSNINKWSPYSFSKIWFLAVNYSRYWANFWRSYLFLKCFLKLIINIKIHINRVYLTSYIKFIKMHPYSWRK